MALEEQLALKACGRPHEHDRTILEVRQDPLGHRLVVAKQVHFLQTGAGIDHALRVAQLDAGALRCRRRRDRRRRGHDRLACDLARRLVGSHAPEAGMPDMALGRPLAERHLDDHFRLDPTLAPLRPSRRAPGLDRFIERRLRDFQRDEQPMQLLPGLRAPSRADAAGIAQLAVLVIAQQQAADLRLRARAVGEAGDDELLADAALQLQPRLAALADVGRVLLLQDHAFETELAGRLQQLVPGRVQALAEAQAFRARRPRAGARAPACATTAARAEGRSRRRTGRRTGSKRPSCSCASPSRSAAR